MLSIHIRIALALLCWIGAADAHQLTFTVQDRNGRPLPQAVIYAEPGDATPAPAQPIVLSQHDKAFTPFILAVQRGSSVDFTNQDPINHHVYSFSRARQFELKLLKGQHGAQTVRFNQPGVITLGCNIHDWMLGYIFVVDTPWFAQSNESGKAQLALPDRDGLQLHVWHPRMADADTRATFSVSASVSAQTIQLREPLNPDPRRAPGYE